MPRDVFRTAPACGHSVCQTGATLDPSCADDCAGRLCEVDPYCCEFAWDDLCVDQVVTVCERDCADEPICGHSPCAEGDVLHRECGFCEERICDADPYCCEVAWDALCVDQVATECGLTCECTPDVCDVGGPSTPTCSPCTAAVCEADPFCCEVAWDDLCVDQVATVCDQSCEP